MRNTVAKPAKARGPRSPRPAAAVTQDFRLFNRQRIRRIDTRLLTEVMQHLLARMLPATEVDVTAHLVGPVEMAQLNHDHVGHEGSTDVITLDYGTGTGPGQAVVGEVFICVADALEQAGQFGTRWQSELTRYLVHALLHLRGYDDLSPAPRRRMKAAENRWLARLEHDFDLRKLARPANLPRE